MKNCPLSGRLLTSLLLSLMTAGTVAHKNATGIVAERMDAMKDMKEEAAVIADMVKGKAALDYAAIQQAADSLIRHGEGMPALFPNTAKSREDPVSEALPAIWQNWQQFKDLSIALREHAERLKRLAAVQADMDAIRAAFSSVADNCSACHDDFREE